MLLLAFKSLFFLGALFAYSTGVWRLINDYFRQEFRTFLDEEVKKNKYILEDPDSEADTSSVPPPVEVISPSEVRKAQQSSVTANRLLDDMILSFGRMFTTGNKVKPSRRQTSGQPTANEIVSSSGTDAPPAATGSMEGEARSYPDPHSPGGGGTVIEADKFPRSSSSELQDNKAESNADRDDANDDSDDDDEKKWIKYWKNREPGQSSGVEGADAGYCEAVADTCG